MRVKAIRDGYYDLKRRKKGTVFNLISSKHFTESWMENLEKAGSVRTKKKMEEVEEEESFDQDQDVI